MNTPLDEIKRLRAEVAQKDRQLAELHGLIRQHLEADSNDPELALRMEQAVFERGRALGREAGWRQGVEHALMEVDRAHWRGGAHTPHGEMRELGLHDGPVPPPKTPDEIVAEAERDNELHAEWWAREYERTHPESERQPANVRHLRPEQRGADREAG